MTFFIFEVKHDSEWSEVGVCGFLFVFSLAYLKRLQWLNQCPLMTTFSKVTD